MNKVTYVYDVFDRRIAKDVDDDGNGSIDRGERYVYDGTDIALVYDRSDNLVERLLYGPGIDQPLASEDGSGDVLWFLADNQGTIRDVAEYDAVTGDTSVVNHIQYGGFGNITAQSNSTYEPRHTYTGREWDADSELFYYRARWYDATAGRFISEDPIGFSAGDTNVVRYVRNEPTNWSDPSGLEEVAAGEADADLLTQYRRRMRRIELDLRSRNELLFQRMHMDRLFRHLHEAAATQVAAVVIDTSLVAEAQYGVISNTLTLSRPLDEVAASTLIHETVHAADDQNDWFLNVNWIANLRQAEGIAFGAEYLVDSYERLAYLGERMSAASEEDMGAWMSSYERFWRDYGVTTETPIFVNGVEVGNVTFRDLLNVNVYLLDGSSVRRSHVDAALGVVDQYPLPNFNYPYPLLGDTP